MLKEYALLPSSFDSAVHQNEPALSRDLLKLLEDLIDFNGCIANLNKRQWFEAVFDYITESDFPIDVRKNIIELLEMLDKRKRIIKHPKSTTILQPTSDEDWLGIIKESHVRSAFHEVVRGVNCTNCDLNSVGLDRAVQRGNPKFTELRKTSNVEFPLLYETVETTLKPILQYAVKILLVDPYIAPNDGRKVAIVEICSKQLGLNPHTLVRRKGTIIEIHLSVKNKLEEAKSAWENKLRLLHSEYGHSYKVHIWQGRGNDSESLHDRHIWTDQSILVHFGRSFDIPIVQGSRLNTTTINTLDNDAWQKFPDRFHLQEDPHTNELKSNFYGFKKALIEVP